MHTDTAMMMAAIRSFIARTIHHLLLPPVEVGNSGRKGQPAIGVENRVYH